jgi:hypothetical protein
VVGVTLAVADVEVEVEAEAKARVKEEMTHAVPVDSWDTGRMIRHAHSSKPLWTKAMWSRPVKVREVKPPFSRFRVW